jgi:hypothetical protein
MSKDITDKINRKSSGKPQSIDTTQFEYTVTTMFTYGTIVAAAITLGITYTYLLIQKIKN